MFCVLKFCISVLINKITSWKITMCLDWIYDLLKINEISWMHVLKNYRCLEGDTSVLKNTRSRRFSKTYKLVLKTPFQDAYVSWQINMCLDWIYDLLKINEISWMYVLKSSQACWKTTGVLRVTKVSWKTLAQDGSPRHAN